MESPTQKNCSLTSSDICESEWSISSLETEGELTPTPTLQEKMQSISPAYNADEICHCVDTQSVYDVVSSTSCVANTSSSKDNFNERSYFEDSFPPFQGLFDTARYGVPEISNSRGSDKSNYTESSMSSAYSEFVTIPEPQRFPSRYSTGIDTTDISYYSSSNAISNSPVELICCRSTDRKHCSSSSRQCTLKECARRNKDEDPYHYITSEIPQCHKTLSGCHQKEHCYDFDVKALKNFEKWINNLSEQERDRLMLALSGISTGSSCEKTPVRNKLFQKDDMLKNVDFVGAFNANDVEDNRIIAKNNDNFNFQISTTKSTASNGDMKETEHNLTVQETTSNMNPKRNKSANFSKNSLQRRKEYEATRTTIKGKLSKLSHDKKIQMFENQNHVKTKRKLTAKNGYVRNQRPYPETRTINALSNQYVMKKNKKVNPFTCIYEDLKMKARIVNSICPSTNVENENIHFESLKHREGSGELKHSTERGKVSLIEQSGVDVFEDFEDDDVEKSLNSVSIWKFDRENLIVDDEEESQHKNDPHFSIIPKYVHQTGRIKSIPFINILPWANARGLNKFIERHMDYERLGGRGNPNTERLGTPDPSLEGFVHQFRYNGNCRNQEDVLPLAKSRFPVLANRCHPRNGNKCFSYTPAVPGKLTSRVLSTAEADNCIYSNARKKTTVGHVPGYGVLRINSNNVKPIRKKCVGNWANRNSTVNDSKFHSGKNRLYSVLEYRQIRAEPAQAVPRISSGSTRLPPILSRQIKGIRQGDVREKKRNSVLKKTKNKSGVNIMESRAKARQFNTYVDPDASARFERQYTVDRLLEP